MRGFCSLAYTFRIPVLACAAVLCLTACVEEIPISDLQLSIIKVQLYRDKDVPSGEPADYLVMRIRSDVSLPELDNDVLQFRAEVMNGEKILIDTARVVLHGADGVLFEVGREGHSVSPGSGQDYWGFVLRDLEFGNDSFNMKSLLATEFDSIEVTVTSGMFVGPVKASSKPVTLDKAQLQELVDERSKDDEPLTVFIY